MPNQPQWGTITVEVPDFLKPVREAINSVAEFLISILDVVLAALQLIKGFLADWLDPILALIQKIIDEINAWIHDIQQMGIYITGDWKLLSYPFDDLRGGYIEYERRMLVRMTDRTDPTRPDVSSRMMVFGMFLYLSVDISAIQRLIAFIMQIIAWFKQAWDSNTLPFVRITEVRYGIDAVDIMNPASMADAFADLAATTGNYFTEDEAIVEPPSVAQVRFKTRTPNKNNIFNPFPPGLLGPGGFIVTVSTVADGIKLCYDKPRPNTDLKPSALKSSEYVQPRVYNTIRAEDGRPIVLYGGADMISMPTGGEVGGFNQGTNDAGPIPGKVRFYGLTNPTSNAPVPLELIQDGDKYYFQRTFIMTKAQVVLQSFTGEYSFGMSLDEMPIEANLEVVNGQIKVTPIENPLSPDGFQHAATVFCRIAACNMVAAGSRKFYYDLGDPQVKKFAGSPNFVIAPIGGGAKLTDVGRWSAPMRVTFPNAYTAQYIQAVKAALVVLFCSRPDLVTRDKLGELLSAEQVARIDGRKLLVTGTAETSCRLESLKFILRVLYDGVFGPDYQWKRSGESPLDFRLSLTRRINKYIQQSMDKMGSNPDMERFVVENTKELRTVTWGKLIEPFAAANPADNSELFSINFLESRIFNALNTDGPPGNDPACGLALNPWCMGVEENIVDNMFTVFDLIRGRREGGMYQMLTSDRYELKKIVPAATAATYFSGIPPETVEWYQEFRMSDGSYIVPDVKFIPKLEELSSNFRYEGSGDRSPVVFYRKESLIGIQKGQDKPADAGVIFCRGIFNAYDGGILLSQANLALSPTASLWRRNDDGNWIAIRFFDIFPGIGDILKIIRMWVEIIRKFIKSIIEAILKFIRWLEARIMEMQAFIRRINAILQELLGFLLQIPRCSALICISEGTDGLMIDFMNALCKPMDSPLAYGAGVALVIPFMPAFLYPFIKSLFPVFNMCQGQDLNANMSGLPPADVIPIEGLPDTPPPGEETPPDVL